MSRKGASSSKFGHLFGDTIDASSTSSGQSRLSSSGDLYKDPLAAFIPPITTTTRSSGATAVKATLSPPSSFSTSVLATASTSSTSSSARNSPPGSGSNSRSSSRLQHHALFSSLTTDAGGGSGGGGSSIFDTVPSLASSTLSAAKRDLLFGEGSSSSSSSSSARRTSTPPLSKTNSSAVGSVTSPQSLRASTPPSSPPPLGGVRVVTSSVLDAGASPLEFPLGVDVSSSSINGKKEVDAQSVKSPLSTSTAPLTRTNSQASTISHESVRSSRSIQSQDTTNATPVAAPTTAIATVNDDAKSIASKTGSASTSSAAASITSVRSAPVKRASVVDQHTFKPTIVAPVATAPIIADPILNPLSDGFQPSLRTSAVASPSPSSLSIDTFQSITRTSSPAVTTNMTTMPPPPVSRGGFARDQDDLSPITRSNAPINVAILDDAAEAFAKDLMFTSGPSDAFSDRAATRTRTSRSSSFLDSGYSRAQQQAHSSSGATASAIATASAAAAIASMTTSHTGGGGSHATGLYPSGSHSSGFSLGEDVADSSNPWMNTLAESMESTHMDYTQPDVSSSSRNMAMGSAAVTSASTTTTSNGSSKTTLTTTATTRPVARMTIPTLDEDVGGFDDMFASLRSSSNHISTGSSSSSNMIRNAAAPSLPFTSAIRASLESSSQAAAVAGTANISSLAAPSSSNWNVLDAVEAAVHDPDFLGPSALVNQSSAKVLEIMQMPKDALDKDMSAQEVFDNPWE
ncbi:hypothetical protein BGZ99_009766 [Dissophora globulifera]|uniref:Uncharacterized protein n=1 Tax=Dissophora globulifera TaxID=979702 RepID=A0A9P6R827_9FUNG|nr:hypothetical protein BGZ99_009766 [Dissophora globulifera]